MCDEEVVVSRIPSNMDLSACSMDCNEDWRLGGKSPCSGLSLPSRGRTSQYDVSEADSSSNVAQSQGTELQCRDQRVYSPAEIEAAGNSLRGFYWAYVAECKKRSRSVHKSIRTAFNDTLDAKIHSGRMEEVRCVDLSSTVPPISDQDVRLLCLALVPSAGKVLKDLYCLKLCDNDIGPVDAARLITLLMFFGNGELQLDLSRNHNIRGIELEQLAVKPDSSRKRRGLRSLVLDGCGIRWISQSDVRLLNGLQSLSLCYTSISNLWSITQALQPLALESLEFQEAVLHPQSMERCPKVSGHQKSRFSSNRPLSWRPRESPVCREKAYRAFVIMKLPTLKMLDGKPITDEERRTARDIVSEHYELEPANRGESLYSVLRSQQVKGTSMLENEVYSYSSRRPQKYSRVFARALQSMTRSPCISLPCPTEARPRQFEYNPVYREFMMYGTVGGEICLLNHDEGRVDGSTQLIPDMRTRRDTLTGQLVEASPAGSNAILGLCWTNKDGKRLLAGADNGTISLFNAEAMQEKKSGYVSSFDRFHELTSLNINCEDQTFLVSGYSNHIAAYDLPTGRLQTVLRDCHSNHINVLKFSHYTPSVFATSSFDHEVKLWDLREPTYGGVKRPIYSRRSNKANVMVCFSPDDRYLLASAVDNEVRQYNTYSGELVRKYDIRPTYSPDNFTRSYFMNGGDYFVTGSCCENVVRIFNSNTGRMLRDFEVESKWFRKQWKDGSEDWASNVQIFVQSLRGDPSNPFNFSVLAASSKCMSSAIVKVNLTKDSSEDS